MQTSFPNDTQLKNRIFGLESLQDPTIRSNGVFIFEYETEAYEAHAEGYPALAPELDWDPGWNALIIAAGKTEVHIVTDGNRDWARRVRDVFLPDGGIRAYAYEIANLDRLTADQIWKECQRQLKDTAPDSHTSTWADTAGVIGPITWAWPGWLPNGMLTIIASEPGTGKSGLCLRVAACYLAGASWPDGTPASDSGNVLWLETEAGQAINLQRASDWGLPIDRLINPTGDPLADIKLDNAKHKEAVRAAAFQPEIRLIIVDSLRGSHSRDENSSDVIALVQWLAELARDTGKPLILTHHLRKRGIFDGDGPSLDRLRGSTAITQPARLVWALDAPDPTDKEARRISVIKSNIAAFPEPIGMKINAQGVSFGEAPSEPRTETVQDRAVDLLLALLQSNPLPAEDVYKELEDAGISRASTRIAKKRLGVVSVKQGKGNWAWSLPARGQNEIPI